jgi:hypothetical protein
MNEFVRKLTVIWRIADFKRENIIANANTNINIIIRNQNENYITNGRRLNENGGIKFIKMKVDNIGPVLQNHILEESQAMKNLF